MLKSYFGRSVFAATLLIGVPVLVLLWFAGGVVCSMALTWQVMGEGDMPGNVPMALNLYPALWRTILSFGIFLSARAAFLILKLRWNIFLSQIMAGVATFLLIRVLYDLLGVFTTPLSVWSVITFVAFLSVFDSLEPERGDRWRAFFLVLFGRSRWRR
jgi:hypothetical protein